MISDKDDIHTDSSDGLLGSEDLYDSIESQLSRTPTADKNDMRDTALNTLPKNTPLSHAIRELDVPGDHRARTYFNRALERILENEFGKAAEDLEMVRKLSPASDSKTLRGLVYVEQANLYLEKNLFALSRRMLHEAERILPGHYTVTELRSQLEICVKKAIEQKKLDEQRRAEEEKKKLERAKERKRKVTEKYLRDHKLKQEQERQAAQDAMMAELARRREEARKAADILFKKANAKIASGDWHHGIVLLKQACETVPDDQTYASKLTAAKRKAVSEYIENAKRSLKANQYVDAEKWLDKASDLVPGNPSIAAMQKNLFARIKQAHEYNEQKNAAALIYEKAKVAIAANDWEHGLKLLKQACEMEPNNRKYRNKYIQTRKQRLSTCRENLDILYQSGHYEEAMEWLEEAIALVPENETLIKWKSTLKEKIDLSKQLPAKLETAAAYLSAKEFEKAREVYRSIQRIDPTNPQAERGLQNSRCLEAKHRLKWPGRLLFLQWLTISVLATIIMVTEGCDDWCLLIPAILLSAPLLKAFSLWTLWHSRSLRVTPLETFLCLVIYFPFGWFGILWARLFAAAPAIKEAFRDQRQQSNF